METGAMQSTKAKAEIDRLAAAGQPVSAIDIGGQDYALVKGVEAPSPPWGNGDHDILIAIPAAYDAGAALDAFYLKLPYTFNGGEHNRVNGGEVQFGGAIWRIVSWHYADGKPFQVGIDGIEGHISHCKGFFFERGATNART